MAQPVTHVPPENHDGAQEQMDRAWEMLQAQSRLQPAPVNVVDARQTPAQLPSEPPWANRFRPTERMRYLLVSHASKPEYAKLIVMEGTSKGPNWTLPSESVDSVLQIVATLGFEVSDLRDEQA